MATLTFDTFKYVEELEQVGIDRKHAAKIVDLIKESHNNSDVATKEDIIKLNAQIEVVKAELSILKWMLGLIGAGILTLIIKSML